MQAVTLMLDDQEGREQLENLLKRKKLKLVSTIDTEPPLQQAKVKTNPGLLGSKPSPRWCCVAAVPPTGSTTHCQKTIKWKGRKFSVGSAKYLRRAF